jgi:hypothetical protein
MLRNRTATGLAACAVLLAVATAATALRGAEDPSRAIRDGFETTGTSWLQEQTDATINLLGHDRSQRAAHEGRRSEHFLFTSGPGSSFFYSYPLPRVPVTEALHVSLFVRANRPGTRIFGRVILPADTDPDTGQPSFVLVPGTIYDNVDRWQRIELVSMLPSIEAQARVIRATTRRPVSVAGAYLERVVVNLYCGPAENPTEIFLDELSVAPVPPEAVAVEPPAPGEENPQEKTAAAAAGAAASPATVPVPDGGARPVAPRPGSRIALERNRLKRNGYDWIVTAIEAPGADVAELRKAGFDILVDPINARPERFREAVGQGFLLQPRLSIDDQPMEPAQALEAAASFPFRDSVAFWDLGEALGRDDDPTVRGADLERVRAIKTGFRRLPRDFSHLTTGTVADQFALYAAAPRNLDMIAVQPLIWGTAQKPFDTYTYLNQRRLLTARTNPGALHFVWISAQHPPEVQLNVWGNDTPPSWGYPVLQPEQLRVYTYIALAAGYRGIGFRGTADLTRTDLGRMLLIEMALLNEEIDLLEPILAQGQDPIPLYATYPTDPPILPPPGSLGVNQRVRPVKEFEPLPFTKVAAIDTLDRKGSLLLVTDYFDFSPYQLHQAAMNDLKLTVPARESAQAWLISPGGTLLLEGTRVPGGRRYNVPDYGPTAVVLVTTDQSIAGRIQAQLERVRPLAVQLAIEQARIQLKWVGEINGRLLADGHALYDPTDPKAPRLPPGMAPPHDEADLLAKSEDLIKSAQEALEREDYELAWAEARRAGRPLRILMVNHWSKAFTKAVKVAAPYPEDRPERRLPVNQRANQPKKPKKPPQPLILPVASPPCLAVNLLPQQWIWVDWMAKTFSRNLVPSGTFDEFRTFEELESAGWTDVSRPVDGLTTEITPVKSNFDGTKRILKLSVEATDAAKIDTFQPYIDFPVVAVRSPEVPVQEGQFLRISLDLSKPYLHVPGHGGVIIRDSIGGEPLQIRFAPEVIVDLTPVVFFRRVPADGVVTVTIGLAAPYGEVFINNFKVEVAEAPVPGEGTPPDLARRPQPPLPDPGAATAPPAAGFAPPADRAASRPLPVPRTSR